MEAHAVSAGPRPASLVLGPLPEVLATLLAELPPSLVIRETHRLLAMAVELKELAATPALILDVGCGDGIWWQGFRAEGVETFGIDIADRELRLAKRRMTGASRLDISGPDAQARLRHLGWPEQFDLVIGNCSIEHIPDIDQALVNIRSLIAPGGRFILFVPTPTWALQGHVQGWLRRHAPRVALALAGALDGFFQHRHLFDQKLWHRLLGAHGFVVEKIGLMGGRQPEFHYRLGLPTAFASFLFKAVFGRYLNRHLPAKLTRWSQARLLGVFGHSFAPYLVDQSPELAYEYMIRCRSDA